MVAWLTAACCACWASQSGAHGPRPQGLNSAACCCCYCCNRCCQLAGAQRQAAPGGGG
jgi:hypothetical protein